MADGNVVVATRAKGGRPKKARGAATSSDAAENRWTIRGVPMNVRAMAGKASEIRGMTVGDWVSEAVVAYVVGEAPATELDALCLATIARFKRPRDYVFVDALPKNNYGKILKTELRAADVSRV